ncbi:hypothetical protein UFOVP119_42 [uncultured Caudovirales phage]|uniref:Uncharacterized protein n=1 Tax=uncultured Caudovirales phage TaxID=2100421 RepID=A0A6J5L725_9CAUD|nr:hypothetical protein UFOVP119_42 [uncultured Caudovirales phage]
MSAMSDYLENKLIDHIFRGVAYTAPAALYVGLLTAGPSDTGGGTEVSGNNYSRVNLAPSTTNWAATNAAASTANPSAGTSGTTSNNSTITFPTPSASWGTVTHFGLYDASTSGNLLMWGALTISKTINSGDTVTFPAASLSVQIDN